MGRLTKRKDFDFVLENYVGGGGIWQWKRTLILYSVSIICGVPVYIHIFAAHSPPHRCFIEGCDDVRPVFLVDPEANFLEFSVPKDHAGSTIFRDAEDFDPCKRYGRVSGLENGCRPDTFDNSTIVDCDRFVFDRTLMADTLVTDLDLACTSDSSWKVHFLGSVIMIGFFTGSIFGGPICDKIGRKTAILLALFLGIPSVMAGGFVSGYWWYIFYRYISCTVMVFGWIGSHTFLMEYFSNRKRIVAMCISGAAGQGINLLIPVLVWISNTRKGLHLLTGVAGSVALPLVYFYIPESSRWLVSNNKSTRAERIVHEIAEENGRTLSREMSEDIRAILKATAHESTRANTKKLSFVDMFKKEQVGRTLILLGNWVSTILFQYSLALNVGDLSGDTTTNFCLLNIASIIGVFVGYGLIYCLGRMKSLASLNVLSGLIAMTMAVISKEREHMMLLLFLWGRIVTEGGSITLWLYTAELYPTNLRSQALGFCSSVSRVFGFFSTFLPELAIIWTPLPLLITGIPLVLAGGLATRLPETTDESLPETVEEAARLNLRRASLKKDDAYEILLNNGDSC